MNQLLVIRKHLKCVGEAYSKIRGEETREMAKELIGAALLGFSLGCSSETATVGSGTALEASVDLGAVPVGGGPESLVAAKETVPVVVYKGNPVLTPVSDHEVEGEAVAEVPEPATVEEIGGWPVRAEIEIIGLSPNRRMLRGRLGEKIVSVERKPGVGRKVVGRLVRAGISPLYRVG